MVNANPCARQEFIWRFYSCKKHHYHFVIAQQKTKHALNCLTAPAFLLPVFQLTRAIHLVTGASPSLRRSGGFMKKPLVTRNDIAEAIALHTACMHTGDPRRNCQLFHDNQTFLLPRTDKAVINKLLIAENQDYLIEQGVYVTQQWQQK
ncbi:putative antirepressor [Escherichia coli]|uniref:Putative antirepressor n=1 Tax=Escherichia coli TaxID=562 RepID=A0A377AYN5_ECOLX|nr:putative antirepressor [Escherichia coli]